MKQSFSWLFSCLICALISGFSMFISTQVLAIESDSAAKENQATKPATSKQEDVGDSPVWRSTLGWVDDIHGDISGQVDWIARGIDEFFSGETALEDSDESYLRWRLSQTLIEGGRLINESDIKFRLDLPTSKKRFRLVLENSPEDEVSVRERNQPSETGSNLTDREGFSAALQYVKEITSHWTARSRLGIKARIPLDPFARFTLSRRWSLGEYWSVPYRFQVSYFHSEGFSANNSLSFERPLRNEMFLRLKTEVDWHQDIDTMEGAQTASVYKRLTRKSGMDYVFGVLYQSASDTVVTSYFLSANYRKLVHKDWLYIDVIPQLGFAREDNYESELSLTFRVEAFFQK